MTLTVESKMDEFIDKYVFAVGTDEIILLLSGISKKNHID
jgi:hypothetical protein